MGQVISALARRGLTAPEAVPGTREPEALYGFRPLAGRGALVTNEIIDKLRDDDVY